MPADLTMDDDDDDDDSDGGEWDDDDEEEEEGEQEPQASTTPAGIYRNGPVVGIRKGVHDRHPALQCERRSDTTLRMAPVRHTARCLHIGVCMCKCVYP